ncbi:MAG: sugar phosphate nucleotidyltransferase [Bacteroidetes bacterium]|nr:sugar phosphate nucleotidyltransferase [Bacteroidota bacterium]
MKTKLAIIILAGGKGTRMNNPNKSKVMFEVFGVPMIGRVVKVATTLNPEIILTVVGYQKEMVIKYLKKYNSYVKTIVQEPQLGTGHAVKITEVALKNFDGNVLVLSGDVPLLTKETILKLIDHHKKQKTTATVLTAILRDPTNYGRIIRTNDGNVLKIVEDRDASIKEKKIKEINSGIYIFKKDLLFRALSKIKPHNAQKEYYLTDVLTTLKEQKMKVSAISTNDYLEVLGINNAEQLLKVEEILINKNKN